MRFIRQRISEILLILGLIAAWLGFTSLVIRQAVTFGGQFPTYAAKSLTNSSVRTGVADVIVSSVEKTNPLLRNIPTSQLTYAVDQALKSSSVSTEFSIVAFEVQQHILGLQNGPITIGGPALSSAVAKSISGNSVVEQQIVARTPLSYTINSKTIPSFGRYYVLLNKAITYGLTSAAIALIVSLLISVRKGSTLRKVGIWFIGFSIFEVAALWLLPRYVLPLIHNGPLSIVTTMMQSSLTTVEPIYLSGLGLGVALTIVSFII